MTKTVHFDIDEYLTVSVSGLSKHRIGPAVAYVRQTVRDSQL